jgi:hypothetical protein
MPWRLSQGQFPRLTPPLKEDVSFFSLSKKLNYPAMQPEPLFQTVCIPTI